MAENIKEGRVSHITSHMPAISLMAIVFGLLIDNFWNYRFDFPWLETAGVVFLVLAPMLIFWAQHSSYSTFKTKKVFDVETKDFHVGPYHFIRHPTYLGLFCLVLGFGFFAHSLSVLILNVIGFMIVNIFILPREEGVLETKYGEKYLSYKKETPPWF